MRLLIALITILASTQAHAVCTRPDGVEGEIVYIKNTKLVQYCDGASWIGVGWKRAPMHAAGGAGQIQFNDGTGKLGANNALLWDGETLFTNNIETSGTITSKAAGGIQQRITYLDSKGIFRFATNSNANYIQSYTETSDPVGAFKPLIISGKNSSLSYIYISHAGIGINGTQSPRATLDIRGFIRLNNNASEPAPCIATQTGSVALTSTHQMCICTTSGWKIANTLTSCTW